MKATVHARYVHHEDGDVTLRQYADGTPALTIESYEDGYPDRSTLSVNLSEYGLVPGEGHIYVPDWSEHEGLPIAMEEAGLGTIVDRHTFGPFDTEAALFKLSDAVLES